MIVWTQSPGMNAGHSLGYQLLGITLLTTSTLIRLALLEHYYILDIFFIHHHSWETILPEEVWLKAVKGSEISVCTPENHKWNTSAVWRSKHYYQKSPGWRAGLTHNSLRKKLQPIHDYEWELFAGQKGPLIFVLFKWIYNNVMLKQWPAFILFKCIHCWVGKRQMKQRGDVRGETNGSKFIKCTTFRSQIKKKL